MPLTVRELILELLEFNLDAKILDDFCISWKCENNETNIINSKRRTTEMMLCTPTTEEEV